HRRDEVVLAAGEVDALPVAALGLPLPVEADDHDGQGGIAGGRHRPGLEVARRRWLTADLETAAGAAGFELDPQAAWLARLQVCSPRRRLGAVGVPAIDDDLVV